jgi:acetyl-CoA carboxylase biotin carboxyl carrier protein
MSLTFKEVSEILKIIDASECEEVVLELEGTRLVVRRGSAVQSAGGTSIGTSPGPAPATAPVTAPQASAPPAALAPLPTPTSATSGSAAQASQDIAGDQVRAPMVGTLYRRPSPDDPPFVELGSTVKAGDPLCLIEVMKLFTTIEAPCDGVVKAINIDDGQGVEFDQLLFVIAPE